MKAKVTHEDVRDDRFPCTCTIACIPQGIAADQKCRLADIDEIEQVSVNYWRCKCGKLYGVRSVAIEEEA